VILVCKSFEGIPGADPNGPLGLVLRHGSVQQSLTSGHGKNPETLWEISWDHFVTLWKSAGYWMIRPGAGLMENKNTKRLYKGEGLSAGCYTEQRNKKWMQWMLDKLCQNKETASLIRPKITTKVRKARPPLQKIKT
jgi:hypothetical protein